jgi:subtilase family protein
LAVVLAVGVSAVSAHAQSVQTGVALAPSGIAQIEALVREKRARSAVEQKMSSRLIYARKMRQGLPIAPGVERLDVRLPSAADGRVVLDVRAVVSIALLDQVQALGAEILDSSVTHGSVRLQVDLGQVDAIAALPDIMFVQPKQEAFTSSYRGHIDRALAREQWRRQSNGEIPMDRAPLVARIERALNAGGIGTNSGSVTSQGDKAHAADTARSTFGVTGAGVKIGVLSDDVCNLASAQASGDLPAVTVLSGQTGTCPGGDEGTAMLEIIHDLAPGAQLYFATAFGSITSFADNIRALRAAGCDIIVDDVGYYVESPFQDGQSGSVISPTNGGVVTQAVKDVAGGGTLYFSAAANSGNLNDGTSGTWEGDFADGGAATDPLAGAGRLHSFGGQLYNVVTDSTSVVTLFWSDTLGGSANDYDIYVLSSNGATIFDASTDVQNGNDDPFEILGPAFAGERIVITKFSGSDRFLHLDTNRGELSIATAGNTHGHATTTAANTFSVAATPAQSPGPYPSPFNSTNDVEEFSSDGPRRIFFNGGGSAITPGNFSSTGGQVLNKPDITAADGVSVTGAGSFPDTFYGTSAAAPHAAAIAALVKSANLSLTASQITTALINSAIDIEASGFDRDSGAGIIMANTAVASVVRIFTDNPLVPGITLVKAVHITELRTRINLVRAGCGLGAFTFTNVSLAGVVIQAIHITEMRTALNAAYAACGVAAPTYTDPTLTAGSTVVKETHITQLRNAVVALE